MQPAPQESIDALWRAALRLRRRSGMRTPLPPLWFFTDPARTPEPERIAERLPHGAGVVYRAFGAPNAAELGRRLARIAGDRGLALLVGADPCLARLIGAAGVHLPERLAHRADALARRRPDWLITCAAHSRAAVKDSSRRAVTAVFVSPIFATRSASAATPVGPRRLSSWISGANTPVIALGGISLSNVPELAGSGAAGVAAIEAFLAS